MAALTASDVIVVREGAMRLAFSLEDLTRYHGRGSPGGVALAFKALELGLPLLAGGDAPERRAITIRTAFGGPGARDAFELVTRAVTDGRFVVDAAAARPERGHVLARFVFVLGYAGTAATLLLREGFVDAEFAGLAGRDDRGAAGDARLDVLKRRLAERVLVRPAAEVFDVER